MTPEQELTNISKNTARLASHLHETQARIGPHHMRLSIAKGVIEMASLYVEALEKLTLTDNPDP